MASSPRLIRAGTHDRLDSGTASSSFAASGLPLFHEVKIGQHHQGLSMPWMIAHPALEHGLGLVPPFRLRGLLDLRPGWRRGGGSKP